jgi:hypothetical protein
VEKNWPGDLKGEEQVHALEDIHDTIERVAQRESFKINVRMVEGAREFKIGELLQALADIDQTLRERNLLPGTLSSIQKGFRDLTDLNIRLQGLIEQHDQWQAIDHELQNAPRDNDRHFKKTWERVAKQAEGVVSLSPPAWVGEYRSYAESLDAALKRGNKTEVEEYFEAVKTLVQARFLEVDENLNRFFGPLCEAGKSLATLLTV